MKHSQRVRSKTTPAWFEVQTCLVEVTNREFKARSRTEEAGANRGETYRIHKA